MACREGPYENRQKFRGVAFAVEKSPIDPFHPLGAGHRQLLKARLRLKRLWLGGIQESAVSTFSLFRVETGGWLDLAWMVGLM